MTTPKCSYRDVLGSDVVNDGMYLELRDSGENIIATVFLSDSTGDFEISFGPVNAPQDIIDAFVERAKILLSERAISDIG